MRTLLPDTASPKGDRKRKLQKMPSSAAVLAMPPAPQAPGLRSRIIPTQQQGGAGPGRGGDSRGPLLIWGAGPPLDGPASLRSLPPPRGWVAFCKATSSGRVAFCKATSSRPGGLLQSGAHTHAEEPDADNSHPSPSAPPTERSWTLLGSGKRCLRGRPRGPRFHRRNAQRALCCSCPEGHRPRGGFSVCLSGALLRPTGRLEAPLLAGWLPAHPPGPRYSLCSDPGWKQSHGSWKARAVGYPHVQQHQRGVASS